MPSRPVAQGPYSLASTSTAVLGIADFGTGMSNASLYYNDYGSTLNVAVQLHGSIGRSGLWTALTAATTLSTDGGVLNSTAAVTFDQVRVSVTANTMNSTDTGSLVAWVIAR